ncbi:M56 family metallopeptidase [Phenylobacterium sp.]|jgi:beta-lactamase regulating signal transducer with metallopeptidase domain|uniref:M56 family metallopeptidase n=1 Tax=Phenylobacterium sp. TaxID=1871053 RepID=UPI002F3E7CBF
MATDLLVAIVHLNLAAAAAILIVLALRQKARRHLGAEVAYRLWVCVPIAAAAALAPAAPATRIYPPGDGPHFDPIFAATQALDSAPARTLLAVWLLGAAIGGVVIARRQLRFLRMARRGLAGPAVTGFFVPRIIMPAASDQLYSTEERALIRAHERAHIDRGDPRTNGFIALAQCLLWFNPLAHIAAREARLDQEFACDAAVLARRSGQKRLYAETLLKTQIGGVATPLGCHWLTGPAPHPLEQRIKALRRPSPGFQRQDAGAVLTACAIALAACGAWKAQPAGMAQGMPPILVPVEVEHHMQAIIVSPIYR